MDEIRPCRVKGLTSERGLKLNGMAASALFLGFGKQLERRVSVHVEGQPKSLSLKYGKLEFFPNNDGIFDGGIGVGRETIRDTIFMATAIDNVAQTIISKEPI
ncbi:expressed unknown protein [Seminavis robusta]|uniref:Uncharacterized protein n=1 Tax=Seminavis robusta TaxID=568900 RepID=A0A9N8EKM3_9STRA|nr:expressed unknown protein [Seminavis robusta]|eukprot:Sro1154_g247150.1 n/a (103) ;mRNA; r:16385-16693